MLTDMERKQEQALKVLRQQVLEASLNMEREEAAEFFGELADSGHTHNRRRCL